MANVIGKQEKVDGLAILVNLLTVFALFSAFASILFACLWLVTSWYTPNENYNEIQVIPTKGGQYFMVEYPKGVLANNKPADLILTLNGPINRDKSVDLIFPGEMRLLGYEENASNRKVTWKFTAADRNGRVIKVIFFHSKTITGPWWSWFSNQTVTISSTDFSLKPFTVDVKMETVGWARIREFVNSSIGDKSPLILLASGLISWAGTFLLQLRKDKQEQESKTKQEEREKKELAKKNNAELWEGLKSNPVQTIKDLADQVREESSTNPGTLVLEKHQNEFRVLKLHDWQNLIFKQVLTYWDSEDADGASQIIEDLIFLERRFLEHVRENTDALLEINELISSESNILQLKDAEAILNAYKCWRNPCKVILQNILVKYMQTPENWAVIARVFEAKKELGYPILRDSKINTLLGHYDTSQLTEEQKETLNELNLFLWSGINWRPLWQSSLKLPSPRIYRWLKYNEADTKHIPFGSEFAELDVDLDYYKIEHPIISQIGRPMSTIVFGEEGTGKTATAFILIKNCQMSNISMIGLDTGVFPIYCRFDDSIDVRTWLVETVSDALIDFVSANPDRFLVADSSRKLAMGRLMQIKGTTVNHLSNSLGKTGIAAGEDINEILKQLAGIETPKFGKKIRDVDVVNLLRIAIPDGFSQVYCLIDISNRCSLEQASIAIRSISDLSLQLAKQNFFFKIFAPPEIKPYLGDFSMFDELTLTWNDELLKRLLERRFDRFRIFCDRKIQEPSESLIKVSKKSPRKLIHYGNSLMQYADANLKETEKLPIDVFSKILRTSSRNRNL